MLMLGKFFCEYPKKMVVVLVITICSYWYTCAARITMYKCMFLTRLCMLTCTLFPFCSMPGLHQRKWQSGLTSWSNSWLWHHFIANGESSQWISGISSYINHSSADDHFTKWYYLGFQECQVLIRIVAFKSI